MRHAGAAALARLGPLLAELRAVPGLQERSTGVFYRKSRAFLHFHEDADRLFADLRLDGPDFERFAATTAAQQQALLRRVRGSAAG